MRKLPFLLKFPFLDYSGVFFSTKQGWKSLVCPSPELRLLVIGWTHLFMWYLYFIYPAGIYKDTPPHPGFIGIMKPLWEVGIYGSHTFITVCVDFSSSTWTLVFGAMELPMPIYGNVKWPFRLLVFQPAPSLFGLVTDRPVRGFHVSKPSTSTWRFLSNSVHFIHMWISIRVWYQTRKCFTNCWLIGLKKSAWSFSHCRFTERSTHMGGRGEVFRYLRAACTFFRLQDFLWTAHE